MRIKFKLSFIRKVLITITLLGILNSNIGTSYLHTARAETTSNVLSASQVLTTPILRSSLASNDVEDVIREAIEKEGYLLAWPGTSLSLDAESIKTSGDWGIAYLNYLSLKDKSPTNEKPTLILLHRVNGVWSVSFPFHDNASEFNAWLSSIPTVLVTEAEKKEWLIPSMLYAQAFTDFITPWKVTSSVIGGLHDGYARDFYIGGSSIGDEVVAAASGIVRYVKEDSSDTTDNCLIQDISCYKKANMVVLDHGGYFTWYVHLKQWSVPITVGQSVSAGTKIGEEGNTGYSTGPHLHLAVSLCADQGANMFWYHYCPNTQIFGFAEVAGTSQTWASGLTIPPTPPCDATSIPSDYIKCAEEGSGNKCSFSGTKSVYYGANSCYVIQQKSNGVECINENFGGDPLPGIHKACYVQPTPCPSVSGIVELYKGQYCVLPSSDVTLGLNKMDEKGFNDVTESIAVPIGWSARLYLHNSESSPNTCIKSTDDNLWDNKFSDDTPVADKDGGKTTWVRVYNNPDCYLKPGDADGDGQITGKDYMIWVKHYGQTITGGPAVGDFDNNGYVDGRDYFIWMTNYGK